MAQEPEAPEVPDTPEVTDDAAPAEDTQPSPVVDYEQRYNNLRPEFDRTKQQLKEYEEAIAAYQAQSTDQDQYEDDEDYVDPYDDRLNRIETLLAQKEQETLEQQHEEQETAYVNSEIERLETEQADLIEEFTDEEWDTIGILSERYRREDGSPDVDRAFEHLFGKIVKPRREKYVSTKKAPQVRSGSAAAQVPDLDSATDRADYIDQALADE